MIVTEEIYKDYEILYDYLKVIDDLPERADVAVIGGAGPRIDMAERAAELYKQNIVDLFIFSGFAHPDFGINEAQIMANKAISSGIPKENIIIEPNATNTGENILLSAQILRDNNMKVKDVILIHRPHVTRRFKATAEAQWVQPQPNFYSTCLDMSLRDNLERDRKMGVPNRLLLRDNGLVYEIKCLLNYPKNAWTTPQYIPDEVHATLKRLI